MIDYLYVPFKDYGKKRREFIKQWFEQHPEGRYAVNCKYRPQVKNDPDLKKLIREGYLKQMREYRGSARTRRTYLVKI